jgi:hypothetical protein
LANCHFTAKYWDFESREKITYNCGRDLEDDVDEGLFYLGSDLCIFHDKIYLEDYSQVPSTITARKEALSEKLMDKIKDCVTNNKALFCIGYFLPENITIEGDFTKPVYFSKAKLPRIDLSSAVFSGGADFRGAEFSGKANFRRAELSTADFSSAEFSGDASLTSTKFSGADFSLSQFSARADFLGVEFSETASFISAKFFGEADFSSTFKDSALFNYVLFEDGKKILFGGIEDLSKFSFMNTEITRVRFSDRARWRNEDKFKVVEEEMLENSLPEKSLQQVSLGSVKAVYRNLRENYEFRLRYDEAGKFFTKEMELKRKYKEKEEKNTLGSGDGSSTDPKTVVTISRNGWLRRNMSLTGLYYHFSNYGESIAKPTIIGAITVGLSTLFWLMQSNPTLQPTFSSNAHFPYSNLTGLASTTNSSHLLKAFERSITDFLPLLPLGSDVKIGVIDYIIKIVGGVLTFGLLAIALRRKFERKYTR